MKKLILFALAALTLAACGNKQETKNNENMKQELNLTYRPLEKSSAKSGVFFVYRSSRLALESASRTI